MLRPLALVLTASALAACATAQPGDPAAFRRLVPADAEAEILADGFTWAEGPLWRPASGDLLFTDVPENTVYRWSEAEGLSVYLRPSGLAVGTGEGMREVGGNGLALDAEGHLIIADSGTRTVMRVGDRFVRDTLAATYGGRRFNSPNDLAVHASGALFFTDPPYGLAGIDDSPLKEQLHNGVYRLDPDGTVTLLVDDLTRPNGIALSPDQRTLYVANSDPEAAVWMAYPVEGDLGLGEGRVLFDATAWVGPDRPGNADGMAVAADGTLFATGPGGVLVLTPDGEYLGTISTGRATANCAFGGTDGRTLYMTAANTLQRIRLGVRGAGF